MKPHRRETIDFFFSYRSPYSYLAAPRVFELVRRFDIELRLRLVLPMVNRGFEVPRAKALYIIRDCRREAKRLRMPFGPIRDPLGHGVRKCLAITERARELGLDYQALVLRLTRAIWAEAADVSRDSVLEALVGACGLEWSELRSAIDDPGIEETLEDNRQRLTVVGHWGVPTLAWRGEPFWGQDRIEDLELALASVGLSTPRGHLGVRSRVAR